MSNYKHRFLLFRTQHSMHSLIHLDFLNLRMGSSNPFLIILKQIFLFQHIKCFPHTFFRKKSRKPGIPCCLRQQRVCLQCERPEFNPWGGKIPWRRKWQPTPVFLPGKSHGWRSLVGYSSRGCKESDTTERLHFHFSLSCIGEGNGNPLQYSCLENPRDGRAWWAAVYGVAQSRTRLK